MTHRKEIQEAINYIERNLCRELSLDDIASAAGFSKYYFHRIFQKETGMSVYDYIRKRRLAGGALLLRTTEMSILDIKNLVIGGGNMGNNTEIKN